MRSMLYRALSAMCFVVAILSVVPQVRAADSDYYCKKHGTNGGCDKNCPSDKPVCEAVGLSTGGIACSGCKAET